MSFDLHRRLLNAVSCVVVTMMLGSAATGQERSQQAFNVVPSQSRPRLVERLRQYVEYEKTGQYARLYELLYRIDAASEKTTSKEMYVASRQKEEGQRGTLQEFLPTIVMDLTLRDGDPPTYGIKGRTKVRRGRKTVEKEMFVYAKLQNGDWYFSEASDSYLNVD